MLAEKSKIIQAQVGPEGQAHPTGQGPHPHLEIPLLKVPRAHIPRVISTHSLYRGRQTSSNLNRKGNFVFEWKLDMQTSHGLALYAVCSWWSLFSLIVPRIRDCARGSFHLQNIRCILPDINCFPLLDPELALSLKQTKLPHYLRPEEVPGQRSHNLDPGAPEFLPPILAARASTYADLCHMSDITGQALVHEQGPRSLTLVHR